MNTAFTDLLSIRHPVVSAPMGGAAGGALAAAVSNAGGLGLVGGAYGKHDWLDRELALVTEQAEKPWGVGLLTWAVDAETVDRVLGHDPAAVMLSFGDPGPYADRVHDAGALLILQVTDLDEARRAVEVGADVIVAQGSEAGGHGGRRATLPFVPVVVDMAGSTPVLAAGGISDGRGLAASLALGAAGVLVGTRFQASREALVSPDLGKALVGATGDDTERGHEHDIARGVGWPDRYTGRAVRNGFLDQWRGREDELRADAAAQRAYRDAAARGDLDVAPVWAGEGVDLITEVRPAGDIVAEIVDGAERVIDRMRRSAGA